MTGLGPGSMKSLCGAEQLAMHGGLVVVLAAATTSTSSRGQGAWSRGAAWCGGG